MNEGIQISFIVSEQEDGERLDRVLAARVADVSRTYAQTLIRDGEVKINGEVARPALRVRAADTVHVYLPPIQEPAELTPAHIPVPIVYEDDDVLVFDKPAGIVAHPAPGHEHGTLVNILKAIRPELSFNSERLGLVHRLDKDTSGVIVVAKNETSRLYLLQQWQRREVVKRYTCLVHGVIQEEEGTIDAPIGRDPNNRKRMAVVANGRPALTHFRVLERFDEATLVSVIIETGRTHQIRVHLNFIGHPIVGDQTYGKRPFPIHMSRQFLHASYLKFELPNGNPVEIETPLPDDLQTVLAELTDRR